VEAGLASNRQDGAKVAGEAHPDWKNIGCVLEQLLVFDMQAPPAASKDAYARMARSVLLSAHRE
jgi:hypothetical protein